MKNPQPRSRRHSFFRIWLACLLALLLRSSTAVGQNTVVLVGAGSSIPAPLYQRWTEEYNKRNPNIQVRYLLLGTGQGIMEVTRGVGDFGAGETQLSNEELKQAGLIELPVALIGIAPIYNLPDVHQELRLSGELLAEIFLGDVKTWDAPQVVKLNPGVPLPSLAIQVVTRTDGKGSNYVFTDFLSKVSAKFRAQIGTTTSPKWPVGESTERSSDMADKVKNSLGAIGYVEYRYAAKNNVSQAAVLNLAGKFVRGSRETIAAACKATEAPGWNKLSASLSNAAGADSFPITSFTWIYVPIKYTDATRGAALNDFLHWIYSDGQQFAHQEGYAILPSALLTEARKKIKGL